MMPLTFGAKAAPRSTLVGGGQSEAGVQHDLDPANPISGWQGSPNGQAHTPLHSRHLVTGHNCLMATNSLAVLAAAQSFFRLKADPRSSPALTLRFWVDRSARSYKPWPQPYFRSLGYLAYARFDGENSVLLDLRRGIAIGRFSPSMASDLGYWQRVIFPALVGMASDALRVTVIHCACVERDGEGLLLAGESGAGKSTLALALARIGFGFLSDDWTYLSHAGQQPSAWGLVTPLKLLPDSAKFFPELKRLATSVSLNGERAYEFEPEEVFGIRRSLHCRPRCLIFLERQTKPGHAFVRMPPAQAAWRLGSAQERLPHELAHMWKIQRETIGSITERDCWLLRYGDKPDAIAEVVGQLFSSSRRCVPRSNQPRNIPVFTRRGPDPMRRLTSTPLTGYFRVAECVIRLATNSPSLLRRVGQFLPALRSPQSLRQILSWRLVCEDNAAPPCQSPKSSSISADGLHLVNLGPSSFLALDAAAGVGMGFLAEGILKKEGDFEQIVLARLATMTEAARRYPPDPTTYTPNAREGGARARR